MHLRNEQRSLLGLIGVVLALVACQATLGDNTTVAGSTPAQESPTISIDLDQDLDKPGHPFRIDVSPDGSEVAVFADDPDQLRVYSIRTGEQLRVLKDLDIHWAFGEALSTDWRLLALGALEQSKLVWDLSSLQTLPSKVIAGGFPKAFSPDSSRLLISGIDEVEDGQLVDWKTGEVDFLLGKHHIHDAAFNPKGAFEAGRYLVTVANITAVSETNTLDIYDTTTGDLIMSPPLEQSHKISFDPTGERLVIGNLDGGAVVLDFPALMNGADLDDAIVLAVEADPEIVIDTAAGGDGRFATSSPGRVRMWDMESGDLIAEDELIPDFWTCVAFTPEGEMLYTRNYSELRSLDIDA
jgi:WD40 repeat protein